MYPSAPAQQWTCRFFVISFPNVSRRRKYLELIAHSLTSLNSHANGWLRCKLAKRDNFRSGLKIGISKHQSANIDTCPTSMRYFPAIRSLQTKHQNYLPLLERVWNCEVMSVRGGVWPGR